MDAMSESDEIEDIREQKKQELLEGDSSDSSGSTESVPEEPVHIEGIDHLQEFVSTHDVVLADFYADWCGPCKMLEPIVADIAQETDAAVAKVDVDVNQQLASQYRVQGVPTVVVFADGEVAEQLVGVREKHHYTSLIEQLS